MRNAFTPPLNVPHSLSVSTETRQSLNHEADYNLPIYNPQHGHSYSEKKDRYSGKILDQSKAETQQGKHKTCLISETLMGLDGSVPVALLPAPLVSLRLESLPVCSSPGQMSHSSAIFYCLGIFIVTWASCLHFTAMASTVSCPLSTFKQGHSYHTLPVLSSSLTLHKENKRTPHSWILHASNPSTTWMALPSLAASLE